MANRNLEVHLESKKLVTASGEDRVRRINDDVTFSFEERGVQMFLDIIDYLDVEHSRRYKAGNGKTYCNIYAYDFCSFTWAFLPRVYWKDECLNEVIENGGAKPKYGENIRELNANSLYDFLVGVGKKQHDWEELTDAAELQQLVNKGHVGIICAKRKDLKRSGHISVVVPEHELIDLKQLRLLNDDHSVLQEIIEKAPSQKYTMQEGIPLQSQAGMSNYNYRMGGKWYLHDRYSHYGFFVNRRPENIVYQGKK